MAYSPEQLDNSTKLAINMAKLCVITFKARQALADNQNIALAAHDPRSLHVARCIKTRQQASLMLGAILPNASRLIDVGGNNLWYSENMTQLENLISKR